MRTTLISDAIATWYAEHAGFAHLLTFLDGQLAAFRAGRAPDYALIRDIVHYLHHFAAPCHHAREDAAFARLAEREPRLACRLDELLQQHRVLAAAGEKLLRLLGDILDNNAVIEIQAVEAEAAVYLLYYHHHMAEEEREILPRAARLLTPEDWRAVSASASVGVRRCTGAGYRNLRERIAARGGRVAACGIDR